MEIPSDRQAEILVLSYSKRNEMKSSSSVAGNGGKGHYPSIHGHGKQGWPSSAIRDKVLDKQSQ